MSDQIERLRSKRGDQDVKFSQIADHLRDYTDRYSGDATVVQQVASFLADVEDVDHDHNADPHRGLG